MKRILILFIMITIVSIGCQGAEVTPSPVPPSSQPSSQPLSQPSTQPSESPAGLFLKVTEPQNETVINANPVRVSGSTLPDVEVSVNGELIDIDEQGSFSVMVELEEGPNIIEVIATDNKGNEDSYILAVIYTP